LDFFFFVFGTLADLVDRKGFISEMALRDEADDDDRIWGARCVL